jgi:hypothetical protein
MIIFVLVDGLLYFFFCGEDGLLYNVKQRWKLSFTLWFRSSDLPKVMLNSHYAKLLGLETGDVLEVGGTVKVHLQAKFAYLPWLQFKLSRNEVKDLDVQYESVLFLCSNCCLIAHAKQHCN